MKEKEKFKSRFPVYVERGFAPVSRALPDTVIPVILEPRIAKRQAHYYPIPKFEEEYAFNENHDSNEKI